MYGRRPDLVIKIRTDEAGCSNTNMKRYSRGWFALTFCSAMTVLGQAPSDFPRDNFAGPPPGFGGRGPGGMGQQHLKLVEKFDKDGDKRLNAQERKAAREYLVKEQAAGRGRRGPRFRFGGESEGEAKPGPKVSANEVKAFPQAPLYDPQVVRTLFLEFEDADWEKELADFKNTDVEVPAKLIVDGKSYSDVGVHFRGMSSFMMIGEGRKRSLNLSLDFAHKDQQIGGYRTLNLLNAHEDPTFLRSVLFYQIAREYLPAPKANFVRLVINGESWGVYPSVEQFNKDFVKEWFGTTKGARWKVPGSPGGQGSLAYLGDNADAYKRIYQIKTKDDAKRWADLIRLCKTLNETPPDKLEATLSPLLDINGALKFLALENVMINNDGYWIRTSDYNIYEDEKGQFHILPQDANETFLKPGGPGGPGGRGRGGPGGPGGPGGFGPNVFLGRQLFAQADKDSNRKVTKDELVSLADQWFDKLDLAKAGKLDQEQFAEKFPELLGAPGGFVPPGRGAEGGAPRGGPGGFGPGPFIAPVFFSALDVNKDGSLTRGELKETFRRWAVDWDKEKAGAIDEEQIRTGLAAVLPQPNFGGGPAGGFGGRGGGRGRGGFPGGVRVNGVELDPLIAAKDENKPLLSKLLAVPALRTRYLGYVREIADKWLDWKKLGPIAEQYHALIADDVKADTRKLYSTEAFEKGLTENVGGGGGFGGRETIGLKNFADQRRAYLLNHAEVKKAAGAAQ